MRAFIVILLVNLVLSGCSSESSKINETGKCIGCDLSSMDFKELTSTEGLDLSDSTLRDSVISDITFLDVDFSGSTFEGVTFNNVSFKSGNYSDVKFLKSTFNNVSFTSKADLSFAFIDVVGEHVKFRDVMIEGLELRSGLKSIEFLNVSGQSKRISGNVNALNFDSGFNIKQFSEGLVDDFIEPYSNRLGGVFSEVQDKSREMRKVVVNANLKMSHVNSETGRPTYNPYTPDLIKDKLESTFRSLRESLRGEGWGEETEVLTAIYDSLSDDGKIWYDGLRDDNRFIHDIYLRALNKSGVQLCRAPELPRLPQTRYLDKYSWLRLINLNNNFDSLMNLAKEYSSCRNDSVVELYEDELIRLSKGLDEINTLGQSYSDKRQSEEEERERKIQLAKEKYEMEIKNYVTMYFVKEEIDKSTLLTHTMIRAKRMSIGGQAKMMSRADGVEALADAVKADIKNQTIRCSYQFLRNSWQNGMNVLKPASNEANLNLKILDLLVRVKNDSHEVIEADLKPLKSLGFTDEQIAKRITIATERMSDCYIDALTRF